jgi:glycosyltransferase involved in cell wall biosynthesis
VNRRDDPSADRPLRIALFHATLPEPGRKPGGVETAVHRLANALVDLGKDEVTVFSCMASPPPDARYEHRSVVPQMRFVHGNPFGRIGLLPLVLNFIDFRRFDILHLHGDDWFFLRRQTATVRTFHGSALREAQHATNRKYGAFMYGVYGLEHLSARLSSLPLAIGKDAAVLYGLEKTVSNGVDDTVFFPGPKTVTPRVLFVGTWTGRKRGKFVYETFLREVLPRVPDAELCMVSDYCPPHPRVIAETFPKDATLAQRFREAWVFALPSTYEGFGIPYLEALSSGTAVVATPNPGAREVLDDGRYAVLSDDEDFGSAVAELLMNRERRERLASAGVEHARQFSWRAVARNHRELFVQALEKRGSALG